MSVLALIIVSILSGSDATSVLNMLLLGLSSDYFKSNVFHHAQQISHTDLAESTRSDVILDYAMFCLEMKNTWQLQCLAKN